MEVIRLYSNELYDAEFDATPVGEIMTIVDHPTWDKPKKAPYIDQTPAPSGTEITEAQILALLGVPDVVSSLDLVGLVLSESGKSLIANTEIARLLTLKQNVYEILLPASGSVAGRLSGATIPSGWSIAANAAVNLMVTHTLTGQKVAHVNVFEIDGSNERLAKPFSDGYVGILANGSTVLIEGLDPEALALRIELIFT